VDVRYNPVIPVIMLVIGVVNAVLGLILLQSGGSAGVSLFLGPLFVVLGLLQLTRTYFEFDPATGTIVVKALIGSVSRRFGGTEGGRLLVDGSRIMCVRADGRTKKVPVSRLYARGDHWREVIAQVTRRGLA
jgi:hypothetical protein